MNTHLRTIAAVALLAALVPAQTKDDAAALARAKVIEEQEGDLKSAESAYRALLGDAAASAVHGEAALRLGAMLWRLDKKDDAKPFLERAVAAGGDVAAQASAVLQGQGEAGKQAQERLERARALVQRIGELAWKEDGNRPDGAAALALRDLKWLGEAAVLAQVDRLSGFLTLEEGQLQTAKGEPRPDIALFVSTLWEMGTEPAQQFLARIAVEGTVWWRRFVTKHADNIAPDLIPALVTFLHDADPTGEVQRNLDRVLRTVPPSTLVELTSDAHAGARAAGFTGLAAAWANLSASEQVRIVDAVDAPLRRALRDPEPRPAHAAWKLVSRFAVFGPRTARRLVLGEIARFPDAIGNLVQNADQMSWPLDDAEMDLFLAAGRALAPPAQPQASSRNAREALRWLFQRHQPEWSARSVDAVIELLELGYGSQGGNWLATFFAMVKPEQLARFVSALPQLEHPGEALELLARAEMPAGVFPALRNVIDAGMRAPPRGWDFFRTGPSGGQVPGGTLMQLLRNVGKTGSPEAAIWLAEVDRLPGSSADVARALLELVRAADGEPVRAGLRKLLVAPDATEVRSELFAELARLGDEPSIALFPRAYPLGLADQTMSTRGPGRRPLQGRAPNPRPNESSTRAKGIGFLGLTVTPANQPGDAWHGYSDTQLVQAWRTLLSCDARDEVWAEIQTMQERIPLQVFPLLAAELPTVWAKGPEQRRDLPAVLRSLFRVKGDEVTAGSTMRTSIEGLLRAEDAELAGSTFEHLPAEVARTFADEARALLRRVPSPGSFAASLQRAGIDLRTEDWQLALRDKNNRYPTLFALTAPLDPTLQRDLESVLRDDPSEMVRAAAANTLARLLAMDAVAPLLEALRDPSATVRDAAKEALERFRFQREQQAFWANAKAGIDTSPASAAAKLLAQAKPGEAKDQRLLAIRSLATLGAAESLPYLIEWTKDADAEIAAAARAAVAKIHETAGAKK